MGWQLFSYTDASAPSLTGQVGSLITVLDACLVNGYGSRAAAGWSKAFTGTNKASYRMGSGRLRGYIDVDDSAVVTAKEARIISYESMTALSTGTSPVPSGGGYLVIRKSATADSTARAWMLAADDRTFVLFTNFDSSSQASGTYFGEFLSYLPNDNYALVLIGRHLENDNTWGTNVESFGKWVTADYIGTILGHYLFRDSTGVSKSINAEPVPGFGGVNGSVWHGFAPFPNPADGSLIVVPVHIRESGKGLRGMLRGVYGHAHASGAITWSLADTVGGIGANSGKTFTIGFMTAGAGSTTGPVIIESSDTVARN